MIVLDTHVWIWWVDDHPRLRRQVRDQIDLETDVRISAISLLEVATATSLGRLSLLPSAARWLEIAQLPAQLRIEPLTADLCLDSTSLPASPHEFHRDPADRLIVALARKLNAPLITADQKILSYTAVKSIPAE